jgi:outer membrane lipoprotein LolB
MLTACTTTKPATSTSSPQWHAHQQAVQQLSQYQTRGSFAYLSDKKKVYARFFWQQYSPEHYRLLLTNPLGSTEVDLNVRAKLVQLINHQGKRYINDNADEMIHRLSGMAIPLNNLRQWILGLPGGSNDFTLDDQYRLSRLNYQQGNLSWEVYYQHYSSAITPPLPILLELKQGNQHIKLKIDSWELK